jgi:hypothetical protein
LNNLSNNTTLSINNHTTLISYLNATSTTFLGLINGHTTSISLLNATSTTFLGLINGHTTSISFLNATSTTLLSYINALTNPTTLNVNNLNVSQNSVLNGVITCVSSLNVSGLTTLNNNTNIKGIANINNGNTVQNGKMQNGSLIIGDSALNYGNQFYETLPSYDGPNWTTNTSSLLFECYENTEIAVHANNNLRVSSLLSYEGATNTITIGRNMGWGVSSILIAGNVTAPNLMRRQAFIFTCSTPITINGSTYYRYDIDLNLYTRSLTRYSGSTLLGKTRKFNWKSWLTSGVHENGYDLNYEISCSYKYTLPNLGLSICSYGWPFENKLLSSVNPNGPFLLRNSIDYITFCCSIQNTVITAMIIDYL